MNKISVPTRTKKTSSSVEKQPGPEGAIPADHYAEYPEHPGREHEYMQARK